MIAVRTRGVAGRRGWGGGGGGLAYRCVPPQKVWLGGNLVWNRESFSRELRGRVNVKKKKVA